MEKLKVLVLGNDPQINDIDFSRLNKNVITLGINRIWLKHIPNYFFFNDYDIVDELIDSPEILAQLKQKSFIFSSDWLKRGVRKTSKMIPNWVKVYDRPNKTKYPDSATTAMEIFRSTINRQSQITFYVAGVSLRWKEPSHFWKELGHPGINQHSEDWYLPRFEKMLLNFKHLKGMRYDIVSVNPESNLNRLFRYENIGNLYSKELERDFDSF